MKKIIFISCILMNLVSSAQKVSVHTSAGMTTTLQKKEMLGPNFVNLVGFEFDDKFGIEYGFSYDLNKNDQQLLNYLYGSSPTWVAGHTNHIIAIYRKTKREEGSCFNIGGGISLFSTYTAADKAIISNKVLPFIKLGMDHTINDNWKFQINSGLGSTFIFTVGISRSL